MFSICKIEGKLVRCNATWQQLVVAGQQPEFFVVVEQLVVAGFSTASPTTRQLGQ